MAITSMTLGELTVLVHGRRVEVRWERELVATALWDGARLRERVGTLAAAGLPQDHKRLWDEMAVAIAKDEREALAQSASCAYDGQGVDLTLIDWMLGMPPTDRLHLLERHAAGLAPFVLDDHDD